MSNLKPDKISTDDLCMILREMADRVVAGDSFEGNIQYSCLGDPEGEDVLEQDEWLVTAVWRVGNRDGQGGVRMVHDGFTDPPSGE